MCSNPLNILFLVGKALAELILSQVISIRSSGLISRPRELDEKGKGPSMVTMRVSERASAAARGWGCRKVRKNLDGTGMRTKVGRREASGREVRMNDRRTVELALAEGMTHAEAAALAGAARSSVTRCAAGRLPMNFTEVPRGSGKMDATSGGRKATHMSTRGPLARQRRVRGLLRRAQGRVLPRAGLARLDRRGLHRRAVRLHPLVPRGSAQGVPRGRAHGVRYDPGPQGAARAGRLGRYKKTSASPYYQ